VLGKDVGAIEPVLMQHSVDGMQNQALGIIQSLQTKRVLKEFWSVAHVEQLRWIADVPKSAKRNAVIKRRKHAAQKQYIFSAACTHTRLGCFATG